MTRVSSCILVILALMFIVFADGANTSAFAPLREFLRIEPFDTRPDGPRPDIPDLASPKSLPHGIRPSRSEDISDPLGLKYFETPDETLCREHNSFLCRLSRRARIRPSPKTLPVDQ